MILRDESPKGQAARVDGIGDLAGVVPQKRAPPQ